MDKSITVQVETRQKHPMYGKFIKKTKKFMAHDESNTAGIGDTVRIIDAPIESRKRWRLVEVVEKAK